MRLVAVLGYSDRRTHGLHPVCAARLARAEREARPADTVLLSGWARHRTRAPEAERMAHAWTSPVRRVILDRNARSTIGNAVGANPIGWLIPCHRVIRETGALGGYRWGLTRKQAMLAQESGRYASSSVS